MIQFLFESSRRDVSNCSLRLCTVNETSRTIAHTFLGNLLFGIRSCGYIYIYTWGRAICSGSRRITYQRPLEKTPHKGLFVASLGRGWAHFAAVGSIWAHFGWAHLDPFVPIWGPSPWSAHLGLIMGPMMGQSWAHYRTHSGPLGAHIWANACDFFPVVRSK